MISKLNFSDSTKKAVLFLMIATIILFFGNNLVSLWDQDEAAYAGFAKNMLDSGNWLMPEFMWSEVHRKPPLHFWNITISYKLFGVNEFAVRFPSALFILLTLVLTYFGTKKIFLDEERLLGMIVLGTSFLVMSLGKVSVTDATLLFFTTLCAVSTLQVLLHRDKKWIFFFWVGFSMALLTKGPPVILFMGVFAFLLFLFHPQRKNLFLLHPWFFLPISLMPLFYWGYLCRQSPEGKAFIDWMIDWYILKRVGGSVFGQTGPPGTHLLGFLLFFMPYFMVFPKAVYYGVKDLFNKEKSTGFLLATWFISGWFIYELTPSKLPAYTIAAHIPLSMLIGRMLLMELPKKGMIYLHIIINSLLFLALIVAPVYLNFSKAIQWTFGLTGLGFIIASLFLLRHQSRSSLVKYLCGLNIVFQGILWCLLLPVGNELKNGSLRVAQFVEQSAPKNAQVIIANNASHPPSLPFYLKQRFTKVAEEYQEEELLKRYLEKDNILVLNKAQIEFLSTRCENLAYTEIKPIFTDRIQQDAYYIVKSAPK